MDSAVTLVPAQSKHIGRIARNMRQIDREECEAFGREPKSALRFSLFSSTKAWTALVDGRPEAMFGVVVESAIDREASPWFLGTDEVYRHGRELLMWGPGMVSRLCDSRMRLSNLVSAKNMRAIRLLDRWGFTVADEVQMVGGVPFRRFERVC